MIKLRFQAWLPVATLILGRCRMNAAFRLASERRIYAAARRQSGNCRAPKAKMRIAGLAAAGLCLSFAPVLLGASSGEAEFLSEARQIIFEGKRSGEGYFSPDGQQLI